MSTKAITISQLQLTTGQAAQLAIPTPQMFVRSKPGRGGKRVNYVEGGYVVNQLNKIFGPCNWTFKITERGETTRKNETNAEGEVWVYGELTVHDHKRGLSVSKGQYGQHPIHQKIPMGDALKAAGTDALKKCASLFGVALDVYWGQMDSGAAPEAPAKLPQAPAVQPPARNGIARRPAVKNESGFDLTKRYIEQTKDKAILANLLVRIEGSDLLTGAQKFQLKKLIDAKLGQN